MTQARTTPSILSVRDLSISFSASAGATERPAVDGVGFEVLRGRVLALVGESGSGKTATAMSVLGLLPATASISGSVRLDRDELLTADAAQLRRVRGGRVGMVFQEPMNAFTPAYRIGWQISEAVRAHSSRMPRREVRMRVAALLASVGLTEPERVMRSFPHELSGGQLQRAMIAMALSCDPIALIADEPTTALDVTVQAGILDLLRSLRDQRQMAILLITHDMGVVADLADDVIVLRHGQIVETGTVETVFASPVAAYTRALLDAVPRIDRAPAVRQTKEATSTAPAAEVVDATIVYGSRGWGTRRVTAVEGASFAIARGRTLGLVGESGSGKSTLGRAFAGLVPLAAGTVTVDGVDLSRAGAAELRRVRRSIGYVFQDPASSINPRATIGDAIVEPLRLHTDGSPAERRARAAELLDAVQLPRAFAERLPHELSGGQRQRVVIARALALRPALLIADEPTSALDVSVQAAVLELLGGLQKEFDFACLFISHDLAVVRDLADDLVVLRRGRIVEAGPTHRVFADPTDPYTRMLLSAAPVPDPEAQRRRRSDRLTRMESAA
jgi:peptide/nickel transport system ATP-binding protein